MWQGFCQALEIHLELKYHPSPPGVFNAVGIKTKQWAITLYCDKCYKSRHYQMLPELIEGAAVSS